MAQVLDILKGCATGWPSSAQASKRRLFYMTTIIPRDTIDMLVHAGNRMSSRRSGSWSRISPAKQANLEERRNEDRELFHQAVQ